MQNEQELNTLWQIQQMLSEYEEYTGDSGVFGLVVFENLICLLAAMLFPRADNKAVNLPGILCWDGLLYGNESARCSILESGDWITHEFFLYSDAAESLLTYYSKSPFWGEMLLSADFTSFGYTSDDGDDMADKEAVMRTIFEDADGCFFEDKCIEVFLTNTGSPVDYFNNGEECESDNCLALKSYLLPYYLKLKREEVKEEHLYYMDIIENSIKVLSDVFGFGSIQVMEEGMEASYFVCFDGCGSCSYCYPYGTYAVKKTLLLAGILIDKAMFCLDEYYHIIPSGMKEKEVCNER